MIIFLNQKTNVKTYVKNVPYGYALINEDGERISDRLCAGLDEAHVHWMMLNDLI